MRWTLPAELSELEQRVAKDLQRVGKLHVFLRKIQPQLFDEAFQAELAQAYGTPRQLGKLEGNGGCAPSPRPTGA